MVARKPTASRPLAARSWDVLARSLFESGSAWTVHSVFQRAFNLRGLDGALLGVVTAPAGNAPATLTLAYDPSAETLLPLLRVGDHARVDGDGGNRLTVEGRLVLDVSSVELWDPPPIQRTLSNQEVCARLRRAVQVAARHAPQAGLAALLPEAASLAVGLAPEPVPQPAAPAELALVVDRARAQLRLLSAAIRKRRWPDASSPARELSGLGPGLTPAGDDLLAGLALGLRAAQGYLPAPLATVLSGAVEGRTTDLAVARVHHAVAGRADEAIHVLLLNLLSGGAGSLDEAVRTAVDYGHSSGIDTLVGLVAGLTLGLTATGTT
jgi:hypothetical protein